MIANYKNERGFEYFVTVEADRNLPFVESVDSLMEKYLATLKNNEIPEDSAIFIRFHLSDAVTQGGQLEEKLKKRFPGTLVSYVQQPPASGSKIAAEVYLAGCRQGCFDKHANGNTLVVTHGNYKSLWETMAPSGGTSPYDQTLSIFEAMSDTVTRHGGTVKDNVIRTWVFVQDIDNNYRDMVDARRDWFQRAGMTKDTHYIASTGIEGSRERPSDRVIVDYLTVMGILPRQVEFMNAIDHLCPTYEYNVTFERGTRISYGDRIHYYISGTASIDSKGKVMHEGDVIKQAGRTIENISTLLKNHGASLEDMKLVMAYIRDGSDHAMVHQYLQDNLPESTAFMIVTGAICRPSWLIEMDGIAVTDNNEKFSPYC